MPLQIIKIVKELVQESELTMAAAGPEVETRYEIRRSAFLGLLLVGL